MSGVRPREKSWLLDRALDGLTLVVWGLMATILAPAFARMPWWSILLVAAVAFAVLHTLAIIGSQAVLDRVTRDVEGRVRRRPVVMLLPLVGVYEGRTEGRRAA